MQVTRVIYRLVSQTNLLRHTSHSGYNNAYCTLSSSVVRPRCLQHLGVSAVHYSQSTVRRIFLLSVDYDCCLSIRTAFHRLITINLIYYYFCLRSINDCNSALQTVFVIDRCII